MFSLLSSALLMLSATPRLTTALPSYPGLRHTGPAPRAVNASIYVCEDVDWGNCATYTYPLGSGTCAQLYGKPSSIGPDKGFQCVFWKNGICRDLQRDDSLTLAWPGVANLLITDKGDFNDDIQSFQCFETIDG